MARLEWMTPLAEINRVEAIESIIQHLDPSFQKSSNIRYFCPMCRQEHGTYTSLNTHLNYCSPFNWVGDTDKAYEFRIKHMIYQIKELSNELAEDLNSRLNLTDYVEDNT